MSSDRRDWEELAEHDPLWAVLSDPARKGGRWELGEFLETGEREAETALASAAALGRPGRFDRALDVGCGVGRVTRALAGRFEQTLGVDASVTMVGHARRLHGDVQGCEFRVLPATRLLDLEPASFDLVWSVLVLQHLPREDAELTLRSLVRLLRPDGIAIFQLPYATRRLHSLQLSRGLYRLARGVGAGASTLLRRTPLTPMRMTALPEERVHELVAGVGGRVLSVEPYGDQALPTPSRLYFVAPAAPS
jgi:SAM-dependent methyltransferase